MNNTGMGKGHVLKNGYLHKLRREELLKMLLELERENERLVQENERLSERLASRELEVQNAGSLAEASLRVSGVFDAAQDAADIYVQNVSRLCEERASRSEELLRQTEALCLEHVRQVRLLCDKHAGNDSRAGETLEDLVRSLFAEGPGHGEGVPDEPVGA